jgi:hypothetical protein
MPNSSREAPGFLFSFLFVSRVWDISSGITLASHWLKDCANITPTPEENNQCSANYS